MTSYDIIYMVAIFALVVSGIIGGMIYLIDKNADRHDL